MTDTNKSPDMVRFDSVIRVITNNAKHFKDEKGLAQVLQEISSLTKYDYKPVSDNITNNNTTVNLIAESPKVKQLIDKIKDNM